MITGLSALTSSFAASRDGAGIALRRRDLREASGWRASRAPGCGSSCISVSSDQQHRRHRRRHRDLVGAHRGFAEMRAASRRVVPFDEIAHHARRHPAPNAPIRTPRRALGGVDGVADHHEDRHAVASGVVERHRGVLQADRAVRQRQHRLAFDLGIAVRHRDRHFLVACR